jgi:16S rRNA (guanine(966)-N(2))-methyltransferase RsmD
LKWDKPRRTVATATKNLMRIISGSRKGRRIESPDWPGLRPTSDRLRETLFNILAPAIRGSTVLDGYAGTGAVGIEALSRGASHVTFVDADPRAVQLVARNLAHCGITEGFAIIRADLEHSATSVERTFDLIFLDPPYDADPARAATLVSPRLRQDGLLIIEHRRNRALPEHIDGLARTREVRAGDSALAFYRAPAADAGTQG